MYRLEQLAGGHDRDGFACGSPPLEAYLRQTAGQHMRKGISRTFVLVEDSAQEPKPVLGYFTLSLCQIQAGELAPELARRLPRDVAGLRLGRLAVATPLQRQGLGRLLLVSAMRKAVEVHESAGGIGLFVDAKDDAAKAWYQRFGFVSLPDRPLQLFLPLTSIRQALQSAR